MIQGSHETTINHKCTFFSDFLIVLIGYILCGISLVRAMRGRRKVPYISISALIIPIMFFIMSKYLIIRVLEKAVFEEGIQVSVSPEVIVKPKVFLQETLFNFYKYKGASGSHPTDKKYILNLCQYQACFVFVVAQDSRESSMYWVGYQSFIGGSIPVGFRIIKGSASLICC